MSAVSAKLFSPQQTLVQTLVRTHTGFLCACAVFVVPATSHAPRVSIRQRRISWGTEQYCTATTLLKGGWEVIAPPG